MIIHLFLHQSKQMQKENLKNTAVFKILNFVYHGEAKGVSNFLKGVGASNISRLKIF